MEQKNSRKRLNSLILLVAFTAVMLIVSTYAWFSSQKNVTIGNLEGKVNVAEGLMVSLDADRWSQEVDFSDFYDAVAGVGQYKDLGTMYDDGSLYIKNNLPTELLPVSTTGKEFAAAGISGWTKNVHPTTGAEELTFYNGTNVEGTELYGMKASNFEEDDVGELAYPGFFAIDIFLQNSSKVSDSEQGTAKETLQLNTNSMLTLVTGGSELTGLQNTARVALAMYKPNDSANLKKSEGVESSVYVTANQSQILKAYDKAEIGDVAIWEPNADKHVEQIVTNNNRLTWDSTVKGLYLVDDIIVDGNTVAAASRDNLFVDGDLLPTYGLTKASLTVQEDLTDSRYKGIKDVYKWNENTDPTTTGLQRQIALQTKKSASSYTTVDGGVRNLVSVTSSGAAVYEEGIETGKVEFQMLKNSVIKCRLYVWLEGQDVDCINHASHGSGVHLDLGLVKQSLTGPQAS